MLSLMKQALLLCVIGTGLFACQIQAVLADEKTDTPAGKAYTGVLPGSKIKYEMLPIPGGEFLMGSPKSEENRDENEGPQVKVKVEPFWMLKTELTWEQYKVFINLYTPFKALGKNHPITKSNKQDAVTIPTPLYEPSFTYELGQDPKEPAVTMTAYTARQYCKWLSKTTGHFYRLPTEAEWEYACRAGTTTAFHWGNDPEKAGDYAWYFDNADEKYQKVGLKKPNPWGLYDMHGNVAELVLDELDPKHYNKFADGKVHLWHKLIKWPTQRSQRVFRGGSWDSDLEDLRSASRKGTDDKEWKISDPNLPKSPWWYTEDQGRMVGFRFIRPVKQPSAEEMGKHWDTTVEDILLDIQSRLDEGRGIAGPVDKDLPKRVKISEDESN